MKLKQLLALALLAFPFARSADAQCGTPDNLDVGFPCGGAQLARTEQPFTQQALGICWQNCGLAAQATYMARWTGVTPSVGSGALNCGWYDAGLRIYDLGGNVQWGGRLALTYSRTWMEVAPSGAPMQVWRYLANGDLRATNPLAFPCGTPSCAASFANRVRFTGYIDYANECGTAITERAWMLTHACDAIDHEPGFPRSGVFHPGRNYTFVGPDAGFVVGVGAGIEVGASVVESMRQMDVPVLPARCRNEEPIVTGSITAGAPTCLCGTGPTNWHQGSLTVAGAWGSLLTPFLGSDPFRSFPIGAWTNPAVFPGVEELRWNCNEGRWTTCSSTFRQEYYFGVTTIGGFPANSFNSTTPSAPLPPTFIDQSNSVLLPANIATRNRPYRSDHVLNLNL